MSQGERNLVVRASEQDIAESTDAQILNAGEQNLSKTLQPSKWNSQFLVNKQIQSLMRTIADK